MIGPRDRRQDRTTLVVIVWATAITYLGVRRFLPAGMRRKLAWLLLCAGLIPLALFGAAAIESARSVTDGIIRSSNQEVATRAAQAIELHLAGATENLDGIARLLGRGNLSAAQKELALLAVREPVRAFAALTLVDATGAVLSSTLEHPMPLVPGDPALAEALAGRRHLGRVTFGSHLVPRVRATVPVEVVGKIQGVLVAELELVAIWQVVDAIRIGRTGAALIVGDDGRLVAHGDARGKALVIEQKPLPELAALARTAAAHGGLAEGRGSLGLPVVAAFVPISGTTWTLVIEQEAAETYRHSRLLAWLLAALAVGTAALTIAIGAALASRSLLTPVLHLQEAAEAYRQRRFDHRVTLTTGDELETFGHTLNNMAAALARAYEDLALNERAQAFGLLAAGLTHDLKHPVGDLQAVLMRTRGREGPDVDRLLGEAARRAVPRLAAMIEQLRDLGRASKRHDTDFSAGALLEVLDGFEDRARDGEITLERRGPDAPLEVRADAMLLSRAIENLVSNALEATPAGGRITLTVAGTGTASEVLEIRVRDTGPGIPAEVSAELFRPFTALGEAGLGLGLHVVRRVVEAHRGEVLIARPPEGGTEFALRLPIVLQQLQRNQ